MPRIRRSGQSRATSGSDSRRLLERSSARVTAITAPAGSGKSRLVQQWLDGVGGLDGSDRSLWVRIDLGPEDRGADPAIGAARQRAVDAAVGHLSGTVEGRPKFALIGLEMLADSDVSRLIDDLVDRLPDRTRVVLAGAGSGLPAGCLVRLDAALAELRSVDLWWSPAELIDQLARTTGISATAREAEQLFRLTAGWPAGTIILGRAMRSRPAVLEQPDLTADPEVLDFVTAEVLDRLPPPVRRFVLRTAVLAELVLDDCAGLVPDEIPQSMLAQAHRQGLTSTAGPALGYRPLIRAAALRELRSGNAGAECELLRSAGEQARSQGRDSAAVDHLAAGQHWDAVLSVLLSSSGNGFRGWDPSRLGVLVQNLPEPVWAHDAERRALVAFAAGMSGDHLFAAQIIQQTPVRLRDPAGWWPVLARLIEALAGPTGRAESGYRAACSALEALEALEVLGALKTVDGVQGREVLQVPPILGVTDRPSLTGTAHVLAARAAIFDRDPAVVRRHLEHGWSEAGAQIPRYCLLAGLGADALTAVWGGQLGAAQRRVTRAQQLADEAGLAEHPMLSLTVLARAELLRARGRSRSALSALDAGAAVLSRGEPFVATASGGRVHTAAGQILRALLHLDLADPEAARAELERLDAEGDDDQPRNLAVARALAWARLHLLADQAVLAERVLAAAAPTGTVTSARIAGALQRRAPQEAQELLREWPFEETLDNRIRRLLAVAAIALALDRRPEAADSIDQALVAAEPDGHVQVFLEAPPQAQALLSAVLRRSLDSSGWRADLADRLDRTRTLISAGAVLPVTRRERAVLEHLTTTLTHAQIAGRLFVSDNTLKSHCRNLYRKLGVNTRADAVSVARARGWLEPDRDSSPQGEVVLNLNITPDPAVVEL